MANIFCERCGKDLKTSSSRGKRFCSKECRINQKLATCKCGKEFITWDAKKAPKTCGDIVCAKRRVLSQQAKDNISTTLGSCLREGGIYYRKCKCGRDYSTTSKLSRVCVSCRKLSIPKFTIAQCRKGAYASISSHQKSGVENKFGDLLPDGHKRNDRDLLDGLEIDYLYDNLAVEYHGAWHYSNFHDHYESVVKRDEVKHKLLMEKGYTHYVVGWCLSTHPTDLFYEQHAFFVSQLFEEVSPFKFAYNRNVFLQEYKLLQNTMGKSGYICNNIINWFHNYRWFQKTKTHNQNSIDYWINNKDKVIANRMRYSDIKPIDLRRYFLLFDYTPSLFSDVLTKRLVNQINGDFVVDPFAGYGNRLLGVCSAGKKYLGFDINHSAVNANKLMIKELNLDADCVRKDSSTVDPIECDGLITCPPYGDKDDYGERSNSDYYDMIRETFKRISIRDKGFIVIKKTLVDFDKFCKAVGHIKYIYEINWGGLNRNSMHQVLVI